LIIYLAPKMTVPWSARGLGRGGLRSAPRRPTGRCDATELPALLPTPGSVFQIPLAGVVVYLISPAVVSSLCPDVQGGRFGLGCPGAAELRSPPLPGPRLFPVLSGRCPEPPSSSVFVASNKCAPELNTYPFEKSLPPAPPSENFGLPAAVSGKPARRLKGRYFGLRISDRRLKTDDR